MSMSPFGTKFAFLGAEGYVHIADSHSKQWICDLKMNTTSRSATFLDETYCMTSGFDGDVYIWDTRYAGRCVNKFHHEDGTATSSLATYIAPELSYHAALYQSQANKWPSFFHVPSCFLSIGTMSGVASIFEGLVNGQEASYYNFNGGSVNGAVVHNNTPKPLKSVMNLTTKISTSAFHPSGQILAIASREVSHHCFVLFGLLTC